MMTCAKGRTRLSRSRYLNRDVIGTSEVNRPGQHQKEHRRDQGKLGQAGAGFPPEKIANLFQARHCYSTMATLVTPLPAPTGEPPGRVE